MKLICLGIFMFAFATAQAAWAATCAPSSTPKAVVQAQVDAYNKHDVEAFASCYADQVTIVDLAGKRAALNGMDALKTVYAFLNKAPREFGVEILRRTVSGPVVVDLERIHGLSAGQPSVPDSLAVYEVRDGRILHVSFPPAR